MTFRAINSIMRVGGDRMDNNTCKNCEYFRQHYSLDKRKIFRVFCGHCVFGRVKRKRPYDPVCENFASRESQEDPFVSKEYLSKELLEYMMGLDLFPGVEEMRKE